MPQGLPSVPSSYRIFFALNPKMLFIDAQWYEVVMITITALIGMFGMAAGLGGYIFRNMKVIERIMCIAGGLTLLIPGSITDIIGLVLVGAVCVIQYGDAKKQKLQRKRVVKKNLRSEKRNQFLTGGSSF